MADKVKGQCPKCKGELTVLFNSGIIDLFGSDLGTSKPQECPSCNALLDLDVEVKKTYCMIVKEHVIVN